MARETVNYLTEEQQQSIEGWVESILPLIERYPTLQAVDLVIEGGVGTGVTMAHIAKRLFPNAFYVGTDLAERLMIGNSRQSRTIDERALSRACVANNFPSLGMDGATIYGNCLDTELVLDIAEKIQRKTPLLASYNALNALLDRKMNPWDRKYESDMITIEDIMSLASPYVGQIHIGADWNDEGATSLSSCYFRLESIAQAVGWTTERFDIGLLLLRG